MLVELPPTGSSASGVEKLTVTIFRQVVCHPHWSPAAEVSFTLKSLL
jgi:hypothetical protein